MTPTDDLCHLYIHICWHSQRTKCLGAEELAFYSDAAQLTSSNRTFCSFELTLPKLKRCQVEAGGTAWGREESKEKQALDKQTEGPPSQDTKKDKHHLSQERGSKHVESCVSA